MPREKIYKTARTFERAVLAYFDSISVMEQREYAVLSGHTSKGKPKYSLMPLLDAAGNPVITRRYISPPGMAALCVHLNISKQTLKRYAENERYAEIINHAKLLIEAYLAEQVTTRDSVAGVKFNLEYNYGWHNRPVSEDTLREVTIIDDL